MLSLWLTFIICLIASLGLTPLARRLAVRLNAIDTPDGERKLHAAPVPLMGGFAVYVSLVLGLVTAWRFAPDWTPELGQLSLPLLLAAGFVCLLGSIDDRWDLNARFKLLLQFASVLPIVMAGFYVDRIVMFGYPIELGWWGIPLTVLWLVGCINALNLLDGMDGLASVVGMSTAVMMAIIATSCGQHHVALIAVALAGALAGFIPYNLPPASIYLGDSGSMVIGLVVGILGIQGALKTSATLAITAPAVVMSIPMLDTVLAIIRRKLTGRRFDQADRGHIHHRLLDRGLTTWQALCTIGALCLATGAAATAATILRNDALAWITIVSLIVLLVRLRVFGHDELSLIKLAIATMLSNLINVLVASTRPSRRGARAKLATLDFEDAWSALIDELALWQANSLELFIEDAQGHARHHDWNKTREAASSGAGHVGAIRSEAESGEDRWTFTIRVPVDDGGNCRLRVEGDNAELAHPWHLLRIARVVGAFGRYWANHPQRVSTSLRVRRSDPSDLTDPATTGTTDSPGTSSLEKAA